MSSLIEVNVPDAVSRRLFAQAKMAGVSVEEFVTVLLVQQTHGTITADGGSTVPHREAEVPKVEWRKEDVEDLASKHLEIVRDLSVGGGWIPGADVWRELKRRHVDHPFMKAIDQKSALAIRMTDAIERVRHRDFRDVEKRKRGNYKAAPVEFRVRPSEPE